MQQDVEAGRKTEVELFAGTVIRLAEKHGLDVPVNRALYDEICAIERAYCK
jgi:2-dehydropantoate 2-reductase